MGGRDKNFRVSMIFQLRNRGNKISLCEVFFASPLRRTFFFTGFSEEASKIITEYTAPRLMLIQFDYQKGKMAVAEAKGQMELLLTDMRKSVRDSEIVMENTDMAGLKRAKALLNDGQLFYEEILNKNRLEKQKQKQK